MAVDLAVPDRLAHNLRKNFLYTHTLRISHIFSSDLPLSFLAVAQALLPFRR